KSARRWSSWRRMARGTSSTRASRRSRSRRETPMSFDTRPNPSFATQNILRDPKSPEALERTKYESQYTEFGPGKRPYVFRPYPMMLHKAGRPSGTLGGAVIIENMEVGSEQEADMYRAMGF